jgi:hypothetical protein
MSKNSHFDTLLSHEPDTVVQDDGSSHDPFVLVDEANNKDRKKVVERIDWLPQTLKDGNERCYGIGSLSESLRYNWSTASNVIPG